MDPSCGKCLGSDCGGFSGYTDPSCPEHGNAATADRKAELDRQIAGLTAATLRKLAQKAKKQPRETARIWASLTPTSEAGKLIRQRSETIIGLAQRGRRRAKLFDWSTGYTRRKPEATLAGAERLVYQHFKSRVNIVFREVWRDYRDGTYEVWAVW